MTKTMKRVSAILIVLLLLFSVSVPLASAASAPAVKNVIIMIADGMSVGGVTLARWYKGGTPLAINKNEVEANGRLIRMKGITVYNGAEVFVPQEALGLAS